MVDSDMVVVDKKKTGSGVVPRFIIWSVSWIILSLLMISPYYSRALYIHIGDKSPISIFSPKDFSLPVKSDDAQNQEIVRYKKNQPIISAGETVTADKYQIINRLGLLEARIEKTRIVGLASLVLVFIIILEEFIRRTRKDVDRSLKKIFLINVFLIIGVLIQQAVMLIPDLNSYIGIKFNPIPKPGFLAVIAIITMPVTIMIDLGIALMVGLILSVFSGYVFSSVDILVYNLILVFVSVFSVAKVLERKDISVAGLLVGLASAVSIILLLVFEDIINVKIIVFGALGGLLSGIIASVVSMGVIPVFESIFGIATPMLYIELSNPNHPLLRKLALETPGTYHHSSMVATLAESAAEAIGADSLLARIGGYFHDVGKLKRPDFFVENQQILDENPHSKLAPQLSAKIILSHVRDGVEMAKKYQLPSDVLNIIEKHHGNSLVYYFFQKYLQKENLDVVSEDQFRYPSGRPSTKEEAIVMLADTTEAAVRSAGTPNPVKIENIVKQIVSDKIEDGQLSCSPLSLAEIDTITKTLIKVLIANYHSRIEYSAEKIAQELETNKKAKKV